VADPRTDFFASGDTGSGAALQDPRTAFFASGATAPGQKEVGLSLPQQLAGVGELALTSITGGAGSLADALTGSDPGTHDWAYRPRTEGGKVVAEGMGEVGGLVSKGYDKAFNTGPLATTVKERLPEFLGAAGTVAPAIGLAGGVARLAPAFADEEMAATPASAQGILDRTAAASPQSMGAAAAAPRLAQTSPELQQAVVNAAQRNGGAVNPDALARHVEADTLPVPVKLTEGQALQDPVRISNEQNLRGQNPSLAQRFNEQNGALVQNLQSVRDEVGPDVFTTNQVEHGDTLIKAYQDKAAAADAATAAKYQALKDANGGQFPVDPKKLLSNVEGSLHDQLLYEHAPTELGQLQQLAQTGNMTLEQFEAMRTNVARTMRSSTDGNVRAAAGVIRQQMEELPLSPAAAKLKGLADDARASARTQFQALDADPAYKAAVNETVPPDKFVQKFVINGNRDDLATMRQNLSDSPVAQQTIGVATLDHLRKSAGISDMGDGNFTQAGFNKQLQALGPKMNSLVDPRTADTLEQIGNVARNTQLQPRGSFVNNSNTLTGALAEHAGGVLEGAANVKAGGFPVGTIVRNALGRRAAKSQVNRILAPGAGLDVLETQ
jgi:hypothetical protein